MFGTIRRHQKWLWIVISTVTIISFVAFFSPNRRRQAGWTGPRDQVGSINGRAITRDQYAQAYREAELRYLFSYGDWPGNDAASRQSGAVERETRNRLVLLDKINELDIQVGEPAVAAWIADTFRDRTDKTFRKDTYENFIKNVLPSHGLTEGDFERFARHEVAIQHIAALAGAAGKFVPPKEAESMFKHDNEELEAEAVFISSSNYLAQVTADPTAVATYYTNHLANYRIPEKIQVSYVKFGVTNYLAEADKQLTQNTNINRYIESTYLQRGTNSFKDATGLPLTPDAAKEKIRDEVRRSLALDEAKKKAIDFANELFDLKDKTNALPNLAAAKGLVSAVTPPFAAYETPPGLNVPSSFNQAAAKLSAEQPYAEQYITAEDGIYIMAFDRRIPSEVPALDNIREKVTQDYQTDKALELARNAGRDLHTAITNSLAQGKTFDAAVADRNLTPVVLQPFSRKASMVPGLANPADGPQVARAAESTAPGKVSDFVPTRTGGFVVYVKNVLEVPEAKLKADLPEFTKTLRQNRQYEAFSDWFRKQVELARVTLPGDKRASAR